VRKKLLFLFASFSTTVIFSGPLIYSAIVDKHRSGEGHRHGEEGHHHGHHKAHHGGVLNVIGRCETGHIEIRLEGDTLKAWLVGGGHDTGRSVPIKAQEIPLTVTVPGQGKRILVLKANPMKLGGEKVGHCSRFIAKADWLRDVKKFEARGELVFKGIRHQLLIKYPEGYDPMHGPGNH